MKTDVNFLRRPSRRDVALSFKHLAVLLVAILVLMVVHYQYQLSTYPDLDTRTDLAVNASASSMASRQSTPGWLSGLRMTQEQMHPAMLVVIKQLQQSSNAGVRVQSIDADLSRQSIQIVLQGDSRTILLHQIKQLSFEAGDISIDVINLAVVERASQWQARVELRLVQRLGTREGER